MVEWGVVPGLDHQIAGLDFARAGLGYVVGSWSCRTYSRLSVITNNKAESNRKKGKGRAQITARSTQSRTKRARHRKSSNNTRRTTAVTAKASKDECGEKMTKRRNDVQRKGRKRWQGDRDYAKKRGGMRQTKLLNSIVLLP